METSTLHLRSILSSTNNTPQSIQKSASAMLKYYDKAATLAVTEWRNSLQTSNNSQKLLTLLYVANEVLQTSKRNRGANFLEAFSPVLKTSLVYICEQDRSVTEKVRRTAKIWADRRVFSTRFVGDLLQGLNVFRDSSGAGSSGNDNNHTGASTNATESSTNHHPRHHASASGGTSSKKKRKSPSSTLSSPSRHPLSSSSPSLFEDEYLGGSSVTSPRPSTLQLNVDLDQVLHAAPTNESTDDERQQQQQPSISKQTKRRRSENSSPPSSETLSTTSPSQQKGTTLSSTIQSTVPTSTTPKVLNTEALLTLLQNLASLSTQFQQSQTTLSTINPSLLTPTLDNSIVGDELSTMYTQILQTESMLTTQLQALHNIATQTKQHETEIQRYIPYLQLSIQNDAQDLDFCNDTLLTKQLPVLQMIYEPARNARTLQKELQQQKILEEEEVLKQRLKAEEREKSLKEILDSAGHDNVKPGMVWNTTMREYVYVHDPTDDSWRDH